MIQMVVLSTGVKIDSVNWEHREECDSNNKIFNLEGYIIFTFMIYILLCVFPKMEICNNLVYLDLEKNEVYSKPVKSKGFPNNGTVPRNAMSILLFYINLRK